MEDSIKKLKSQLNEEKEKSNNSLLKLKEEKTRLINENNNLIREIEDLKLSIKL